MNLIDPDNHRCQSCDGFGKHYGGYTCSSCAGTGLPLTDAGREVVQIVAALAKRPKE